MATISSVPPASASPGRIVAALFAALTLTARPLAADPAGPVPSATVSGQATPTPTPAHVPDGIPVPGKPGFLRSPYAPDSGVVDVSAFKSGDLVRDPFTKKLFRVP